jgi:hypothetical protein
MILCPKLVVHIGLPKTATTTLQRGLFSQLLSEGVVYLGNEWSQQTPKKKEENARYSSLVRLHGWAQIWVCKIPILMPLYELLLFLILKSQGPKICVISEEYFTNFFFGKPRMLKKFASVYDKYFEHVELVLCLRDPFTHFNSLVATYGWALLSGSTSEENKLEIRASHIISAFQQVRKNTDFYNYDALLMNLENVSKTRALKVLFFEDFLDDRTTFLSEWDNLLSLPSGESAGLVDGIHENTRDVVVKDGMRFYGASATNEALTEIVEAQNPRDGSYERLREVRRSEVETKGNKRWERTC